MRKQKNCLLSVSSVILCLTLIFSCISPITAMADLQKSNETEQLFDITEKIDSVLKDSLLWMSRTQNETGLWGDEKTINDTSYCVEALTNNQYDTTSGVNAINNYTTALNSDVLSRKLLATSDASMYMADLLAMQNKDGGFGLYKKYESEIYDSVLALEAFVSLDTTEYNKNIERTIFYLVSKQNLDGGWSWNTNNSSDKALTARISYLILKYLSDNSLTSQELLASVDKADKYLSTVSLTDMSEANLEKAIYYALLKQQLNDFTAVYDIVNSIAESQNKNGSFYDNYYYTYLIIKYLNETNTLDEEYNVDSMVIDLSECSFEVNTSKQTIANYSISYNTAFDKNLTIITSIYDNDELVNSQETSVTLDRELESVSGKAFEYTVDEKEEKVLKVVSVLKDGEEDVFSYINYLYVNEKPIEPKTEVTSVGITLNDYYGYVGEEKTITASFYMLYSTNVNYNLTVKTKVYGDELLIKEEQFPITLSPEKVNIEQEFSKLTIKEEKAKIYKYVAEFYDGEKLLDTKTEYYSIYDKPQPPTPGEEEPKNNVITEFNVNLDKYCVYSSNIAYEAIANCTMLYNFFIDSEITVKGYVLDGENVISKNEQKISVSKDSTDISFELIKVSTLDISEEKTYLFKAEIYDANNNYLGKREAQLKVSVRPEATLVLSANTTTGKDYGIDLSWNDISGTVEQYGYRLLRSDDDGKSWETRSSWSGTEKVKVLNVYPTSYAESYLKNWMNMVVDPNTGETAGKGLFDIDTVHINNYNNNPEDYLKDSSGNYKYDVILFGTYDCNDGKDLNDASYKATKSFIDNGGGVLFGHDTIAAVEGNSSLYHPYFNKFTDQLGIGTGTYYRNDTSKVNVVLNGFLTNFPWSISGTLNIPVTHCLSQYAGGSYEGTVWMKLKDVSVNTLSNGATNDFYLVTNNQLAMIQTGHSNGRATVDECKVFANTLFYLKQLTSNTSTKDNSFYDVTAPAKPDVNVKLTAFNKDNYSISANMSSQDFGTQYKYRVEGIPRSNASEKVLSNTVVSEAFSDLKGFVIIESDSADSVKDRIKYEEDGVTVANVVPVENGTITHNMNDLVKNKKYYLHIFAVDNANNISEEYVKEICDCEEILSTAGINSSLSCNKPRYSDGETVTLTATAYSTGSSINATADIKLFDLEGNLVANIDNSIATQLTSAAKWSEKFYWKVAGVLPGKYMAQINWYIDGVLSTESQCLIRISEEKSDENLVLSADVKEGKDYSNTLNWTDLNNNSGENSYIPTDFSIVVDCSGSMSGNRISNARNAINNFIDLINEGDRISIIKFTSSSSVVCDFTDDKDTLHQMVSRLSASGGTSVSSGLNRAVDYFKDEENRQKAIILICDGDVDNCNAAIDKAVQNDITVYTINIVNSDSSVLQSFADKTGGKYYYTNIVSDMSEILHYIKLMNDKGEYYYQVQREDKLIGTVTKSSLLDKDFLDTTAPKISSVAFSVTDIYSNSYNGNLLVNTKDKGTEYEYLVNAIQKTDETQSINSNSVVAEAVSGIKGYYYKINTTIEDTPEIINDENNYIESSENLVVELDDYIRGVVYYLHVYAVDNAGNISKETKYKFTIGESLFTDTKVTTEILTDKSSYSSGEVAYLDVSAITDFYKICAKGVVEIYDSNNALVDTIEDNYITEIVSYQPTNKVFAWNVKNITAGQYKASIKWYDGDLLIASDTADFVVVSDGEITDNLTTDKIEYLTNEQIKVFDDIYNNTTNTFKDGLNLYIDIYEKNNDVSLKKLSANVSSIAGGVSKYSDFINASDLGIGEYKAVSKLMDNNTVVTSSSTSFYVVDYSFVSDEYNGDIIVEKLSDKEQGFKYSVTNTGNKAGENLIVRVKVYDNSGNLISVIDKNTALSIGQTVDFTEVYNTEALKINTYPVVLSIVTDDNQETILDNSGFEINIINKYQVIFADYDGTPLDTQYVYYGDSAVLPANPERKATQQYTYTFSGWDTDNTNITKDTVIKALYDAKLNEYLVTFVDYDGVIIDKQSVCYGDSAITPSSPKREATQQYTYVFTGWDVDFTNITKDITVTATYKELINSYKVTFVNYDGTIIDEQTVEYGNSATAPSTPVKDADSEYTYDFIGWDKEFSIVTDNLIVNAMYKAIEIPTVPNTEPPTSEVETETTIPETKPATVDQVTTKPIQTGDTGILLLVLVVMMFSVVVIILRHKKRDL